jgi:hypothetical protein
LLDLEFAQVLSSTSCPNSAEGLASTSFLARQLSQRLLSEYINFKKDKHLAAQKTRNPPKMPSYALRRPLRCCSTTDDEDRLLAFPAEYYGNNMELGYVVAEGSIVWYQMIIGVIPYTITTIF